MDASFLKRKGQPDLAYVYTTGDKNTLPVLMFCGGFRSDMTGIKALYLEDACRARGQAMLRFDYSGHGQSAGRFEDLTLSDWIGDAESMLGLLGDRQAIIAGSSMGGWIGLILALRYPETVTGLVGIAAAPDFTRLMAKAMTDAQHQDMNATGFIRIPSQYGADYIITRALLEDGETHCLLDGPIGIKAPVALIQGMQDPDVPWRTAERIRDALTAPDQAKVILVRDGDHRLSRPEDLALIDREIMRLSGLENAL